MARLTTSADGRELPAASHRLAITRAEAARALGVSINSFERHVQPELKIVRRGKLRLIPVREIERWLEENAEWTLGAP
jgi:Helix-turn-helix domain